jgi:hypothetical protein
MRSSSTDRRRASRHHQPFTGRRSALTSLGYDLRFAAGVINDTVHLR